MSFIDRLLNFGEGKHLRRLEKIAADVASIEADYTAMSDEELRGQTALFRERYAAGETLDQLMPEAFATVREASKRVLGKRPFDVQIMGGAALHLCNIAEMKTGEGKTIVALMPSYLNALTGRGVHVITVNDYLAKTQSEQMGRVHHFLGLTVGVILSQMTPAERQKAYAADITYGTNNEFGFDYLRDNMTLNAADLVQREHYFAIVDEVDSILIDEARTPLIISGPSEENKSWYPVFSRLANKLTRDVDYEVDEKKKTVSVLADGIDKVEDQLGIENLYESVNTPLIGYLNNSIRAKELFHRDKDYVIMNGEVLIVDEHTGRTLIGRRYNEGLHQALEAKEGVEVKDEYQTLATITLQNYFRMYEKLSGMTGTAKTEESEFQKIYGLGVIQIPTNKPMIRVDQGDLLYRSETAKFNAIIDDVVERHEAGQPVLIGTASVAKSELLSRMLKRAGVPHQVLNAKQHEREAHIVAQAGRKGAVTVATNMAGRGTDIMLGGNPEFIADVMVQERGIDPIENFEEYETEYAATLAELEGQVAEEHIEVVEAGGLYVIGSERHESRRIDNQLRGRSGRQGDPGESRFYLSLEDDLLRLFNPDVIDRAMNTMQLPDDMPIEHRIFTRAMESAQKQVEGQNFEVRKNVLKYDDVMNRQRHAIYGDRRKVIDGADVESQLRSTVEEVVTAVVQQSTVGFAEDWDLDELWGNMKNLFPTTLHQADFADADQADLIAAFVDDAIAAYDKREELLGEDNMREFERQVWLTVLDRKWREHLYEMDYLREGIGLRAMAQRDPLVEYQREGAQMFDAMQDAFREDIVRFIFNVDVTAAMPKPKPEIVLNVDGSPMDVEAMLAEGGIETDEPKPAAKARSSRPVKRTESAIKGAQQQRLTYSAPDESGQTTSTRTDSQDRFAGVGRNQPCPCNSGKKFKNCHGRVQNA